MTHADRPPGAGRIRTSDAEREQIAEVLRAAMSEGRLNLAEGEERLAAAYAATYREDLAPLTADLPGHGREALARTPEARAAAYRHVRWHGVRLIVVAGVLTGLWALSNAHFFWPAIPLLVLTFIFVRRLSWSRRGGWPGGPPGWYGGPGSWRGPGSWHEHRHGHRWQATAG